jgi:cytoskeletal protein CcmA (bactofilin family)
MLWKTRRSSPDPDPASLSPDPVSGDSGADDGEARLVVTEVSPSPAGESAVNGPPPSIISEGVQIVGTLHCQGPLHLEGAVDGSITCPDLAVGAAGSIIGEVQAVRLRIDGFVTGSIRSEIVEMGPTARVDGILACASLMLAEGAQFLGDVTVDEKESPSRRGRGAESWPEARRDPLPGGDRGNAPGRHRSKKSTRSAP